MATRTTTATFRGLPVEVTRRRTRSITIRVRTDGTVALSVPWHVADSAAFAFLETHLGWAIQRREAVLAKPRNDLSDGETVPVFGQRRVLAIDEAPGYSPQAFIDEAGRLAVCVPPGSGRAERAAAIRDFLSRKLKVCIEALAARWAETLGESPRRISIRDMTSEWGSCTTSRRTMRFNLKLAQAPLDCIEYVVVHEFTHLRVANHGPAFKALMSERMADWPARRRKLNALTLVDL